MPNDSAASKPRPTEGAEINTGCGKPSMLQSVLCGVHAALCWSLCTPLVLVVVLLLSWLFFFGRSRDFGETKKTRLSTSDPSYSVPNMIRA